MTLLGIARQRRMEALSSLTSRKVRERIDLSIKPVLRNVTTPQQPVAPRRVTKTPTVATFVRATSRWPEGMPTAA